MQLIKIDKATRDGLNRRRMRKASYTDPKYVRGYDVDLNDMAELARKFRKERLSGPEENRLLDHVLTIMAIVLEHPKIQRLGDTELDECTDAMFMDAWNSLGYLKDGSDPYSYVYRSAYMAAWKWFKKRVKTKERDEAIQLHIESCWNEWEDVVSDHKTKVPLYE